MSWIQDIVDPKARNWEDFYRNRWQHDKRVRSTHGVNCTGGCSWEIFVKDGIVTWEMQQTDYPMLEDGLPPYEPRGCQRGISFSWYIYSPIRVKYPYVRGALLDLWKGAKREHGDPVAAWSSIVKDDAARSTYQQARGKGGFRRSSWDEVLEIIGASLIHTIKEHGPDRIFGFSPIPAMSYLSYAGGSRFLQLLGGVNMSFYDWYADLPNAFPETWGEQTDVCESADWYNSKYIVAMGSNLNMTRTPDVHFVSEAKHGGAKFVVFAPDFSQVAKYSDWWIPINAGQDTAFWMAANHMILKEFHAERQVPYFVDYVKRYTDMPFLIALEEDEDGYTPGRFLRAGRLDRYRDVENGEWKFLVHDANSDAPRMPKGSLGFRWQQQKGQWNLEMKDGLDDAELDPVLTFLDDHDDVLQVRFTEFADNEAFRRGVPVRYVETGDGRVPVVTVFDLLMAQFAVPRGLPGDYPESYDDDIPYTPAWQEQYSGIGRETVIRFAREFAGNAEATDGKSMVIIGASINHRYNNNLAYRAPITALLLCGCCGRNGGGLNHYVGQEKLTLIAPWSTLAFAKDWFGPPRLQQSPLWHYVNSDQWRYERDFTEYASVPPESEYARGHAIDHVVRAVRMGWMPYFPQFDRSPMELIEEAEAAGAETDEEIVDWIVEQLQAGELKFAVEDPDAPENWPRVWFIWRGNAIQSSAKEHEFFLRHYLGTHDNAIAPEVAGNDVTEVEWREEGPQGKMDLVVDINFRMDTSALYSDIVLPTATWYEKDDLNFGPKAREDGLGAHGLNFPIAQQYDELVERGPVERWNGRVYPSVDEARDAANLLLHLAPEANGEVAYQAFKAEEKKVGLPLTDLAEPNRNHRATFKDIVAQPRRTLISPCWSGMVNNGRAYAGYTMNVERLIPWRTLTGRQHLYVDHRHYLEFGEHLPTYKPKLDPQRIRDIIESRQDEKAIPLNYITPHGKWHIHSTYYDNHRMLTLSRGIEPCWLNDKDAEAIGVEDNDWVEVYNDNGTVVTRAAVSARVQRGTCMIYHATERTISVPKSQERNKRRAGAHNSLTRTRLNPVYLAGGYGQIAYDFNYWGPTGVLTRDTYCLVRKLEKLEW